MTALSPTQVALDAAEPASIEHAFASLVGNFASARWLPASNRYSQDVVHQLRDDLRSNSVNHTQLGEYLAASIPLHCSDGWACLGRALECHVVGDREGARHLGYYAELRAAVAFLASQGIGILNGQHVVCDAAGQIQQIPQEQTTFGNGWGTHVVAWHALDSWASRPSDVLLVVIKAGGRSLKEWVDAFPGGSLTGQVASTHLLQEWGVDLHRLGSDRDARNEASYRPSRLNYRQAMTVLPATDFLRSIWRAHDPTSSPFAILDRHLLRLVLETMFGATNKSANWKTNTNQVEKFAQHITSAVGNVAPQGMSGEQWISFLTRQTDPNDLDILAQARGASPIYDAAHHIEVASRATLLLRLATGASSRLFDNSGISRGDIRFWWSALGEERGLWEPGQEPSNLLDLWADVEDALNDLSAWEGQCNTDGINPSYWHLFANQARSLVTLGACERIPLWSLSP